ncbi:MAG: YkgJ family cysteine cluster protein, partial [Pseudomonadota bacterium]
MPAPPKVFECQGCGECCRGQGGIYLKIEDVPGPARLLGLTAEEFVGRYTEPKHGRLSIKSGA